MDGQEPLDASADVVHPTLIVAAPGDVQVQLASDDASVAAAALVATHNHPAAAGEEGHILLDEPSAAAPYQHTPHDSANIAATVSELNEAELDDLVAVMSSHGGSGKNAASEFDLASVATPIGGFTLHDLFGQHFHTGLLAAEKGGDAEDVLAADWEALGAAVLDPELLDSRRFVETLFGQHVDESMIDTSAATAAGGPLKALMQTAAAADARADVEALFGEHVTAHINLERSTENMQGGVAILHATLPKIPHQLSHATGELWLAELPKVDPNRQVLHVDPSLFICPPQ
jgi:hypothetical protein